MKATDLIELALIETAEMTKHGALERSRDWVALTTPGAPTEFRNAVYRSVLSASSADRRIEDAIAHYRALNLPFQWHITPSTKPLDLSYRLLARGFTPAERLHGMLAWAEQFPSKPHPDIRVERVGERKAEVWLETLSQGWSMPEEGLARIREELQAELTRSPRRSFYFLAYHRGVAAGAASLSLLSRSAHFNGAAVLEPFRGRGLYAQLVFARMEFLRQRQRSVVTVHCMETTSAPICKRLGFSPECVIEVYRYPGPSRTHRPA